MAYTTVSKKYKVEFVIDSDHPECYLAVNVVRVSKKMTNQAIAKKDLEEVMKSWLRLANPNSDFKMTAFFQSYVNDKVMDGAVRIVQAILPLL